MKLPIRSLASGPEGGHIWNRIWATDPYAADRQRQKRAIRRLAYFGLDKSAPSPPGRLLDIGCGNGENLAQLAKLCDPAVKLTGIDFAERAVDAAKVKLGKRADIHLASALNMPFQSESFTHITLFGILEHNTDAEGIMREVLRVANPNARIYLTSSNSFSLLQAINLIRLNVRGYPYGFQKNWSNREFTKFLEKYVTIEWAKIVHSDWDMPVVRVLDAAVSLVMPSCGRYLYFRCRKGSGRG